jgi:hypothetical protein
MCRLPFENGTQIQIRVIRGLSVCILMVFRGDLMTWNLDCSEIISLPAASWALDPGRSHEPSAWRFGLWGSGQGSSRLGRS